jgi:hypothetical protein
VSEQLTLTIEAKVLGQRQPFAATWTVDVPQPTTAECAGDGRAPSSPMTLRDTLALIVTDEAAAFNQRQRQRRLIRVMTREEIERGAESGKVDMGGREPQVVSVDDAITTALQAFEDHLYLVLLDGAPVETLDSELTLREGSRLAFVRLVALVGG